MENNNEFNSDNLDDKNIKPIDSEETINKYEALDNYLFYNKTRNVIYYILGVIEVLLLFRLFFKSLGASTNNVLVSLLYSTTNLFIAPFVGIFNIITASNSVKFVIEPSTLIAMIVYALLAYGIIKLVKVSLINEGHRL